MNNSQGVLDWIFCSLKYMVFLQNNQIRGEYHQTKYVKITHFLAFFGYKQT